MKEVEAVAAGEVAEVLAVGVFLKPQGLSVALRPVQFVRAPEEPQGLG